MGADFLFAIMPLDFEVDYAIAEARLDRMSDDDLFDRCLNDNLFGVEYARDDRFADENPTMSEVREAIIEALCLVYTPGREGLITEIEGRRFVVSGGLSWGESPSDVAQAIWELAPLELTEKNGRGHDPVGP